MDAKVVVGGAVHASTFFHANFSRKCEPKVAVSDGWKQSSKLGIDEFEHATPAYRLPAKLLERRQGRGQSILLFLRQMCYRILHSNDQAGARCSNGRRLRPCQVP